MIGGEDEVGRAARPDLRDARARASTRPSARPGRDRRAEHRRARLPALRPERRRALREDGAQRDRVRADGRVRRGPEHPPARRRRQARSARPTPRPRRSSDPEYYQYEIDIARGRRGLAARQRGRLVAARPDRRGARASRRRSRSSPAGCPTRARAAGRRSRRSTRACRRRCSRPRSTRASPRAASDDFAEQAAVGDAQGVRRPRREEGVTVALEVEVARRRRRGRARGAELCRERAAARDRGARGLHASPSAAGTRRGRCSRELARRTCRGTRSTIYQVDERVAPAGDPDRNLTHLLASLPPAPRPTSCRCRSSDDDLEAAAAALRGALPERFDLVHLGLGPDGHTASLVPGDPVLDVDRPRRRAHRRVPGPAPDDADLPGRSTGRGRSCGWSPAPTSAMRCDGCAAATRRSPAGGCRREQALVVADGARPVEALRDRAAVPARAPGPGRPRRRRRRVERQGVLDGVAERRRFPSGERLTAGADGRRRVHELTAGWDVRRRVRGRPRAGRQRSGVSATPSTSARAGRDSTSQRRSASRPRS